MSMLQDVCAQFGHPITSLQWSLATFLIQRFAARGGAFTSHPNCSCLLSPRPYLRRVLRPHGPPHLSFELKLPTGLGPATSPSDRPSPALSSKAKIGISLGVAVGVMVFTGVLIVWLWKRCKEDASMNEEVPELLVERSRASMREMDIARDDVGELQSALSKHWNTLRDR